MVVPTEEGQSSKEKASAEAASDSDKSSEGSEEMEGSSDGSDHSIEDGSGSDSATSATSQSSVVQARTESESQMEQTRASESEVGQSTASPHMESQIPSDSENDGKIPKEASCEPAEAVSDDQNPAEILERMETSMSSSTPGFTAELVDDRQKAALIELEEALRAATRDMAGLPEPAYSTITLGTSMAPQLMENPEYSLVEETMDEEYQGEGT